MHAPKRTQRRAWLTSAPLRLCGENSPPFRRLEHLDGVLEAEPEEEGVDAQDDADEKEPPDAEIFPAVVFAALFIGEAGVLSRPEDRRDLLRRGRGQRPL